MLQQTIKKCAVISLSGGMDSSSLLIHLLADGYQVLALSFDYGQKHKIELQQAQKLVDFLKQKGLAVTHQLITFQGLTSLLDSTLVSGGEEVPEGHYHEENMRLTVVPNRNKIFSSVIQAAALSISQAKDSDVVIAMGIHGGDHHTYPDCRQDFRDKDYEAFVAGNWDAKRVSYYLPYIDIDKAQVLADGLKACKTLELDYKDIYSKTFTSYKPVEIDAKIYSDYKSASSVERIEAFILQGLADPLVYADDGGIVEWEVVKTHAQNVINEFKQEKI